jgi:dephospho-CoA kinase
MKAYLTAIVGGIGAGKSLVRDMVCDMGYKVYDTDAHAKEIMDNNLELRLKIAEEISADALNDDKTINRQALAAIVFKDESKLKILNRLVHGAVRDDLQHWCDTNAGQHLFVETALLYQSGIDRMVDEVWEVEAPTEVRIERVMKRNNITRQQVLDRIESQKFTAVHPHHNVHIIHNEDKTEVKQRIKTLLEKHE